MIYKIFIDEVKDLSTQVGLFGATADWMNEYREKTTAIGQAICNELGISPEEAEHSEILLKAKTDPSIQFTSEEVEATYASFKHFYEKWANVNK